MARSQTQNLMQRPLRSWESLRLATQTKAGLVAALAPGEQKKQRLGASFYHIKMLLIFLLVKKIISVILSVISSRCGFWRM